MTCTMRYDLVACKLIYEDDIIVYSVLINHTQHLDFSKMVRDCYSHITHIFVLLSLSANYVFWCVYKRCHAAIFLTAAAAAAGQSHQAAQSSTAARMWSARETRQSSPAQPSAASQPPPSDGWKGRKNWQVSRITASPGLLHMLRACPLPYKPRSLEAHPLWAKPGSSLKH